MAIIKKAKNISIKVNKNYIVVAGTITEFAEKITLTATKDNLILSSNKKVITQGLNGGVVFDNYEAVSKEKKITNVFWMDAQMETKIDNARIREQLSLKVQTENYLQGEVISLIVKEEAEQDIQENKKEIQLTGYVDKDGFAILKEVVYAD